MITSSVCTAVAAGVDAHDQHGHVVTRTSLVRQAHQLVGRGALLAALLVDRDEPSLSDLATSRQLNNDFSEMFSIFKKTVALVYLLQREDGVYDWLDMSCLRQGQRRR